MIIADVVVPFPIRAYFSYIFPNSLIPVIGGRVIVPFRSKDVIGIVIAIHKITNKNSLNFKFIKYTIDDQPVLNNSLLNTLIWLSKYYYCPVGSVFFSIIPHVLQSTDIQKNNNKFFLKNNTNRFNKFQCKKKFFLNTKILLKVNKILLQKSFKSWLISEINLYIKIKFYLGLLKKILTKKLQILIIVPYIKDIYKILLFLKKYFDISIDIVHSNLSDKIFLNTWIKVKNGYHSIIIGTKKSIFLPFSKLGLIIIFEEHHLIYKSFKNFKCNIKDVAIFRAYQENIPIILDSNTPSLKTLHNVIYKKFFWVNFNYNNNSLILRNHIINVKQEKMRMGLSETLINKISENTKKKLSSLLIYNPSGLVFVGLICNNCNWIPKCNVCNDYYQLDKYNNIVFCEYCLIHYKKPLFCYNCKDFLLTKFNFSIKEIKKNLKKIFPNTPLLFLMDFKNNKIKQLNLNVSYFSILHAGIIITTDKVVQNYYFPNIKLIGLINIDYYFFSFNFNNIEYFSQFYFNLINLVQKKSYFLSVVIQTSMSNNEDLINLCNKKYFFSARKMLMSRKKFLLPPWSFQIILYAQGKNFKKIYIFLKFIWHFLKKQSKKDNILLWFVGPDPVFLKSKKEYVCQLLVQCSSRIYLQKKLRASLEISKYFLMFNSIKWFISFDFN